MYKHLIRSRIKPFLHDNRIADIVRHVDALSANLHRSERPKTYHFMPVHVVKPQRKITPRKWDQFTDSLGRAKASPFAHVLPSSDIMPNIHWQFADGAGD